MEDYLFDAVITSPPYMKQIRATGKPSKNLVKQGVAPRCWRGDYGHKEGQIGAMNDDDYWHSIKKVYSGCFKRLKPYGIICVVVRDFLVKGKIYPLCEKTYEALLECGFDGKRNMRAMLIDKTGTDLFTGKETYKDHKSFFRRLLDKRGFPQVNYEGVIVCVRGENASHRI